MYLQTLTLRSFRNYHEQHVDFDARKTILVGDNAQGKSNLLEAVELLATLRSHRTSRDRDLVSKGTDAAKIEAAIARTYGSVETASMLLRPQGRRTLARNTATVRRQADFLGALNAVQFSSLDLDLVRGGPEVRRAWLDTLLLQIEPVYAHILQQYEKVLRQRNALLKTARNALQEDLPIPQERQAELALWDAQLAATGSRVMRRRDRALALLAPIARTWHERISGKTESLEITYAPNVSYDSDDVTIVQGAIAAKIEQRRVAEQHLGSTVVGPHRDEIHLAIDGTPARSYGSQGQQRTLVLAIKLAELNLIEEVVGEPPLLLLDDVLAELDPKRQNQLLEAIEDRFQTLVTTTHIDSFAAQWSATSQILTVRGGQLVSS